LHLQQELFYLHTLRVPVIHHRDLKSNNVLVEWDVDTEVISITKLCFGVAKAMTESTVADSLVGTTRWMAPEIVNRGVQTSGNAGFVMPWMLSRNTLR
jgi:serine/threonine protein kinase